MEEKEFQIEVDDLLPLRDVVFYTLRRAILTGQLKPGERLMEVHLAEKLGVSRTPIREAIRKLELEGLVTIIPRRGAEVAEITEKRLNDVLEVRRALDALGAELACERITGEEIRKLKKACEDFEKAAAGNDADAIAKADVAFHDIIIRAAGNQRLEQLVNNLAEQIIDKLLQSLKRSRGVYFLQNTGKSVTALQQGMWYVPVMQQSSISIISRRLSSGRYGLKKGNNRGTV